MTKNYLIVLITILIVGVLTVGCASTPGGQNAQPGQPGSGAGAGANDGVFADAGTGTGSGSGANVGAGADGTVGAGSGAVSDVAAAYPGVFDVLDPDYNRYNDFVQTANGVIYYNKNYSGIYREDPVTGQPTPIVTDCIIPHFIIHGGYIYYCIMQKPD